MTPATHSKRDQLLSYIKREAEPQPSVQGIVAVGSVATGYARPDSDIDAVVFLDPYDLYAVPAEFYWCPSDGSYHSIFSEDTPCEEPIQLDFFRIALNQWVDSRFTWPEARCAELQEGWVAFDRNGTISNLLAQRTTYSDELRTTRLDEALVWLDQHLSDEKAERNWHTLGTAVAHDRLNAAYDYMVQALFAYNRHWRPWRNREMESLLKLRWLPSGLAENVLFAVNAPTLDYVGFIQRTSILRDLFAQITDRLVADGDYGANPISKAFVRSHDEPGRSWNISQWIAEHCSH